MSGPPAARDRLVHLLLAARGHPAVRVRDDHHAVDAEQVDGEHERAQDVVGDPGAGVAEDLRVAGPSPSIASGSMRESMHVSTARPRAATGAALRPEALCVGGVRGEHVREGLSGGHGVQASVKRISCAPSHSIFLPRARRFSLPERIVAKWLPASAPAFDANAT